MDIAPGGAAAGRAAPDESPKLTMLRLQLAEATHVAGSIALALALACSTGVDEAMLEAATDAAISANAELRMALQAVRLARQ